MSSRMYLSAGDRRKLDRLMRKIYALFRSDDQWTVELHIINGDEEYTNKANVSFNTIGITDYEHCRIILDYRDDLLSTFIHECLHAIYQDHSESDILDLEEFMINRISPLRAKRLLVLLLDHLD
ncbi:MAG: hypothetical protein V1738_04100 [Patescibacteria group bacterium]